MLRRNEQVRKAIERNGATPRNPYSYGGGQAFRLFPGEAVRGADQAVEDAGLGEQMAAVGDDVELHLGPGLLQVPGGDRRRAHVVAALDDHTRDGLQPV